MPIAQKLTDLGLTLPAPLKVPPTVNIPFAWVRVHGDRAYIAGHGPQSADGSLAGPFGQVGRDVTLAQGYEAARLAALSMLGSLQRELGGLDRIAAWLTVRGLVNATPGETQTTTVINGFSDLILAVFGPEVGRHARSAVGVIALPQNMPVIVEAVVALR